MLLNEAKTYIGKVCAIRYLDRAGGAQDLVSHVYDATFVPLYGGYLVTDNDDIRLDRLVCVEIAMAAAELPSGELCVASAVAA